LSSLQSSQRQARTRLLLGRLVLDHSTRRRGHFEPRLDRQTRLASALGCPPPRDCLGRSQRHFRRSPRDTTNCQNCRTDLLNARRKTRRIWINSRRLSVVQSVPLRPKREAKKSCGSIAMHPSKKRRERRNASRRIRSTPCDRPIWSGTSWTNEWPKVRTPPAESEQLASATSAAMPKHIADLHRHANVATLWSWLKATPATKGIAGDSTDVSSVGTGVRLNFGGLVYFFTEAKLPPSLADTAWGKTLADLTKFHPKNGKLCNMGFSVAG